uniref:Secreted protein n=1 Tax=Meloidogyne incognita TaxID=6306 RepID=A0A914N9B1_MELIC
VFMFMLWKNCGWEMELNHHGKSPNRNTTDCATIQPIAGLFIFIYVLSASADTTLLPPCETKRPRLLLVFNNYQLFSNFGREHTETHFVAFFFLAAHSEPYASL